MDFHDRRPDKPINRAPRTKTEVNTHLVNDHQFTPSSSSPADSNVSSHDLSAQHDWLHLHGGKAHDTHSHLPVTVKPNTKLGLHEHLGDAHHDQSAFGVPLVSMDELRNVHRRMHDQGGSNHDH